MGIENDTERLIFTDSGLAVNHGGLWLSGDIIWRYLELLVWGLRVKNKILLLLSRAKTRYGWNVTKANSKQITLTSKILSDFRERTLFTVCSTSQHNCGCRWRVLQDNVSLAHSVDDKHTFSVRTEVWRKLYQQATIITTVKFVICAWNKWINTKWNIYLHITQTPSDRQDRF